MARHGKARRGAAWQGQARQARQGNFLFFQEAFMASVTQTVQISPPNIQTAAFKISGTAPYVQARFSAKAMKMMAEKMAAGSTAKGKRAKAARDFDEDFRQAMHMSTDGWHGIPAGAFRQAMISACRLVGFKMTLAKLSVFVEADGIDAIDGIPLVKLEGTPERVDMAVRNATGVADIRVRPMWREWSAIVRVSYDADQFTLTDVTNLLMRVGMQVGIGEGRPDSRESAGLGWGTFEIVN
jgi:hypothetical protein